MAKNRKKISDNEYEITNFYWLNGLKVPTSIEHIKADEDGSWIVTDEKKFGKLSTKKGEKVETAITLQEKAAERASLIYQLNESTLKEKGYSEDLFISELTQSIIVNKKEKSYSMLNPKTGQLVEGKLLESNFKDSLYSMTESDKYTYGKEYTSNSDDFKNKRFARNIAKSTVSSYDAAGHKISIVRELKEQLRKDDLKFDYNKLTYAGHGDIIRENGEVYTADFLKYEIGKNKFKYVMISYKGDYKNHTIVEYLNKEQYEYYSNPHYTEIK